MNRRDTFMAVGLAVFLAASSACAFSLSKTEVIFKEGRDTWVKIKRGNKKLRPFDHPCEWSEEEIKQAFSTVRYTRTSSMAKLLKKDEKNFELFTEEEIDKLAGYIVEAFSRADSDGWVDFSISIFRGQLIIGSHYVTDGVMFVKDGKLNIAFRNINQKKAPDEELNTYDPTKGFRAMVELVKMPGQELREENWVVMDARDLPQPVKTVTDDDEKIKDGENGEKQKTVQPEKTVKERLTELQELYDNGLITEEEYNKKRKEILEDL